MFLLALIVTASLIPPFSKFGYAEQDREHVAAAASYQHLAGTDELGRDRAVRIASALLLGLVGSISASVLATCLAVSVGVLAAFAHRAVAMCLMYLTDLFLTLPWLFLLMMVRSALPLTIAPIRSAAMTFLLLGLLGWPAYARVNYAGAVSVRNSEWLIQGRAGGLRTRQLAWRYVVPHLFPMCISQFLVLIPVCLIAEANLGALGLGISEPLPSWGSMLLALQHPAILASSHWVLLPIVLLVTVLMLLELLIVEVNYARF